METSFQKARVLATYIFTNPFSASFELLSHVFITWVIDITYFNMNTFVLHSSEVLKNATMNTMF